MCLCCWMNQQWVEWSFNGWLPSWTFFLSRSSFFSRHQKSDTVHRRECSAIFWVLLFLFLIFKFVSSQCARTVERFIRFWNFIKKFFNKSARWDENCLYLSVYSVSRANLECSQWLASCCLILLSMRLEEHVVCWSIVYRSALHERENNTFYHWRIFPHCTTRDLFNREA